MSSKINLFQIRRSGGHAIIEWLAKHYKHTRHCNDCFTWASDDCWRIKNYGDIEAEIDLQLYSYEDFSPLLDRIDDSIVVLRDFYNIAASRLKSDRGLDTCRKPFDRDFGGRSLEDVWIDYALLYLKRPDRFILYNYWHTNQNYRNMLEYRWDLPGTVPYSAEFPESKIGNGSSFNKNYSFNDRYKEFFDAEYSTFKRLFCNDYINKLNEMVFGWKVEIY